MLTDEQRLFRSVSEAAWQKQVEQTLALCGFDRIYHTHDSRRSQAGFPDIVAIRVTPDHATLFVGELKRETGRVTNAQNDWLLSWDVFAECVNELSDGNTRMIVGVFRPSDAKRLWDLLQEVGD